MRVRTVIPFGLNNVGLVNVAAPSNVEPQMTSDWTRVILYSRASGSISTNGVKSRESLRQDYDLVEVFELMM